MKEAIDLRMDEALGISAKPHHLGWQRSPQRSGFLDGLPVVFGTERLAVRPLRQKHTGLFRMKSGNQFANRLKGFALVKVRRDDFQVAVTKTISRNVV